MKKLLSLVLVLVMALSLTVPAFAGEKTMITEVNLTVGKTYTDLDTGVSVSVPDGADYTASYGGMEFVVGSDVYFYQITGGDANRWLKGGVPCETSPDVSNADKVFAVINLFTKDWKTHEFAINDGLTVTCNGRTINHKAQAASEEGWFLVGGLSPQVLIDITPSKTSGSTTITANVAKPELVYEIVIPQAVTMNEAGVKEIGAASINMEAGKLKNATANTVISYTASGTNFKLSTDESKTMTATYYSAYTDASTNTVLDSTKAIEVYKNSALVNPLTKLYVGVSQTDWDAAAQNNPGTYTATVTYNFKAEEVEAAVTIANLLATVADGFPAFDGSSLTGNAWKSGDPNDTMYTYVVTATEYLCILDEPFVPTATELTKTIAKVYTYVSGDITLTFNLDDNGVLQNIVLSGAYEGNGTYAAPQPK